METTKFTPNTRALSRQLRAGLGRTASTKLVEMAESDDATAVDRAVSAWLLALHHSAAGSSRESLDYIEKYRGLAGRHVSVESNIDVPARVLELNLLTKMGSFEQAQAALADAARIHPGRVEFKLLAANLGRLRGIDPCAPLTALNEIYSGAGLSGLRFGKPQEISLERLVGERVPAVYGPKVSVLMPAYNCSQTIGVALNGLLAQSWRNLEIVVVDDCSSDDTWSVMEDFARKDDRIVPVQRTENGGAYAARNTALSRATGEYVTVNDADDWVHPQRIEVQMSGLIKKGHAANHTSGIRVDKSLNFQVNPGHGVMLVRNISSVLYRRENILKLGGWHELRVGADSELMERYETAFGKVEPIHPTLPLALILASDQSLTKKGPTSLASLNYGARKEYKAAYRHWHRQAPASKLLEKGPPPFSLPAICRTRNTRPVRCDILYVVDGAQPDLERYVSLWNAVHTNAVVQGFLDWPTPERAGTPRNANVQDAINAGTIQPVVWGETVNADVIVADLPCLGQVPEKLPEMGGTRGILAALDEREVRAADRAAFSDALGLQPEIAQDWAEFVQLIEDAFGIWIDRRIKAAPAITRIGFASRSEQVARARDRLGSLTRRLPRLA